MSAQPERIGCDRNPGMDAATVLHQYWGYQSFLPLQQESLDAIFSRKDSLTVLPTGGGKSLCFQLPAVLLPGTAVVISPLIALMKDQVDSLNALGITAATLNSSQNANERRDILASLSEGKLKLLYLSPEAFASPRTIDLLRDTHISFFAIDEAHCISEWGHEYRPDYRNLGLLRRFWPDHSIHGFTATATERVRNDICQILSLHEPLVYVGSFDRPNLTFRAVARQLSRVLPLKTQITEVLDRHPDDAGIIYCISRAETEELAHQLCEEGIRAVPYHAGLSNEARAQNQDAFAREEADVVVATVAFGMGINRTNVRFVIHTGLPKSLESWQQEAGRAGRDGLPAECIIFYSYADVMAWKGIQGRNQSDSLGELTVPLHQRQAQERLNEMYRFCRVHLCRHRLVVEHFGERFLKPRCGACDVCMGEIQVVPDSTLVARKILSGVARTRERYGMHYVADVLVGKEDDRIKANGHDQLSTFGLLKDLQQREVVDLFDQLQAHGLLEREEETGALKLTRSGWEVMKGEGGLELTAPVGNKKIEKTRKNREERAKAPRAEEPEQVSETVLEGGEAELWDRLRAWRRQVADRAEVPPYVVFSDATLLDLIRQRPCSREALLRVKGIGNRKADIYGDELLVLCAGGTLGDVSEAVSGEAVSGEAGPGTGDVDLGARMVRIKLSERTEKSSVTKIKSASTRDVAFAAFEKGESLESVAVLTEKARSTVEGYFSDWVILEPRDLAPWVPLEVEVSVQAASIRVGKERLKPIFEALGGVIPYWQIRAVLHNTHPAGGL